MNRRVIVAIMAALATVWGGLWVSACDLSTKPVEPIFASGFIEAKDVSLAFEVSGRIVSLAAAEGDEVRAGVPLVKLDDALLRAGQQEAQAALELAQAGLGQAVVSRDGAKRVWDDALDVRNNPLELEARIIAAQGELELVEIILERAGRQDPTYGKWEERTAEIRRDIAEKALQNLLAIRDNPQEINAAVDRAQNAYEAAVAAVAVAEGQVGQAQAALETIEIRLSQLSLTSPISGVVAAQYAEVGEIAQPGVPVLTITELQEVTLTAYVPESKIGMVKLGQKALVSVDSYPGESFSGEVVYISPRALFTPKNIQLKEERKKMVFAVKIRLANPGQKLKPGMPADAGIIASSGRG